MSKLLFLYNNILSPQLQHELKIPLHFISFAYIPGKLYTHFRSSDVFAVTSSDFWGNRLVYGGIFTLDDFDFHIRSLDGYHVCSQSTLLRNHKFDLHHRSITSATPIKFQSLDSFSRLKYSEGEIVDVQCYLGNQQNKKIANKLNASNSCRILDGVHIKPFKEIYKKEEETKHASKK